MHPSYAFDGDLVTVKIGGKVIAADVTLEEAEEAVREVQDAPEVVEAHKATHITTPNGLKGEILARTAATWGDAYTVRFANGEIQTLYVTDGTTLSAEQPKKVASGKNPIQRLASAVEESVGPDRASLKARQSALTNLRVEAKGLIESGVSLDDMQKLDAIVAQAEYEQILIKQALDHIDATEGQGVEPYKPDMQIVPGENIGHQNDGTWLDAVLDDMQVENEGTDYEKFLDDGPTLFVAEQPDEVLESAADTRDRALAHVQAKTAGRTDDKLEDYENIFLGRAEKARRVELAHRNQSAKKEAAQPKKSNVDDVPVEALFM